MLKKANLGHWVGVAFVILGLLILYSLYILTQDFWTKMAGILW